MTITAQTELMPVEQAGKIDRRTPGVHHGISIDDYHGDQNSISKSGLDDIAQSSLHYFARHLDPRRPPPKDRAGDQLAGELLHCALLEPLEFPKRYAVGPDVSRATTVWKTFAAANPTKTCIKPDQSIAAFSQALNVRALPEIGRALARGRAEVSAYWIDEPTGELCRCRPDWVSEVDDRSVILIDAKTYGDASPDEFRRQVARMSYHVQAAWYSDGYEKASGKMVLGFVFAAVEVEWPYAASAIMVDNDAMDLGRRQYRRYLDTYSECRKTGIWPGYSPTIEIISLPQWIFNKEDQ